MKKCKYCGKKISGDKEYCSAECKHETEKYNAYVKRFLPLVGILIALGIITLIIGAVVFVDLPSIVVLGAIVLGLTMIVFPFGNSPDLFGIKKQKILIRCLACLMILIFLIITDFKWHH